MNDFTVRRVRFDEAHADIAGVREAVFVAEQGVPLALEWDGRDHEALHVIAVTSAGEVVGTGRLLPDGRIGRMAVLAPWRGRGVGSAMLDALLAAARERGLARVTLSAQVAAVPFYARRGFTAEGGEYEEAGIPHQRMVLRLAPAGGPL